MGQPSRKGTKAWRKNVDITDVENVLEEHRKEEIQGGKIHERASNDLFFVDTQGSDKIREAIKKKTLVIEEIVKPKSAIDGIVSRKKKPTTVQVTNGSKAAEISKNIKLKIERDAKKKLAKGIQPGDSVKERQDRLKQKKQDAKKSRGGYDLWAKEEPKEVNPYLEPVIVKPIQKPDTVKKRPTAVPNVQITHPGNSYKPKEKDHQEAMELAANEELKKIQQKEKIEEQLSYPPEMDLLPDEEVKFDSSDESESEEEEKEVEEKKQVRKKTRADINRQKRLRVQLQKEKQIQEEKTKVKQVNRIKEIEKELNEKALKDQEQQALRQELQELRDQTATMRTSRFKHQQVPMEIQLPEEIAPTLRELKPEGNLIKDRFKSLEARNMIEPRVPVKKKRKFKIKEVEYHDYKRFK